MGQREPKGLQGNAAVSSSGDTPTSSFASSRASSPSPGSSVVSQRPLSDVSTVSSEELALIDSTNKTEVDFGAPLSIVQMFLLRLSDHPDRTALHLDGASLTFAELHARASLLAHQLQDECHVQPRQIVGQCVDRSVEMVVGILGILLAGAVYCPLNPADPDQRILLLLDETECVVLLTQQKYVSRWRQYAAKGRILPHEEVVSQQHKNDHSASVTASSSPGWLRQLGCHSVRPEDTAYMIHTSGSTGVPKSALIKHGSFCYNTLALMHLGSPLSNHSEVIQNLAACSHDMHVFEILGGLLSGATVVMLKPHGNLDMNYITQQMEQYRVTTNFMVPAVALVMLQSLLGMAEQAAKDAKDASDKARAHEKVMSRLASVRYLHLGGDLIPSATVQLFHQHLPHIQIWSMYGPAETTICSSCHLCTAAEAVPGAPVPLGFPLANYTQHVLGERGQELPLGQVGEICIGGPGVFAGYWKQPEVTKRALFFHERSQCWLYKSGDLGKYTKDGNIVFCGRADFQVKLRGQRLEIGEIEATISRHPHIQQVMVIKREEQVGGSGATQQYLAAYLQPSVQQLNQYRQAVTEAAAAAATAAAATAASATAASAAATTVSSSSSSSPPVPLSVSSFFTLLKHEVRALCASRLAGYMVPSAWIVLEQMGGRLRSMACMTCMTKPAQQRDVCLPDCPHIRSNGVKFTTRDEI